MSENRCRRCNRKLKDPNALYGWRCAKIVGENGYILSSDRLIEQAFYDSIVISNLLAANGNENLSTPEWIDLLSSIAKWFLAAGVDDDYLQQLAYDDSVSLTEFLQQYRELHASTVSQNQLQIDDELYAILLKEEGHGQYSQEELLELQQFLQQKEYLNNVDFANDALTCFQDGKVFLSNGQIVYRTENEGEELIYPILYVSKDRPQTIDYGKIFLTSADIASTTSGGLADAILAVQKKDGKINKKESSALIKAFAKVDQALLESNIAKYAGKIATGNLIYDIASCSITTGTDLFDDGKLGEETAKAIAGAIAGGAATAIFAPITAGLAIPTVMVAAATITSALALSWIAEKGVEFINSKRGQKELSALSNNLTKSLLDNPEALNSLTVQLAQSNEDVATLVNTEIRLAEEEVGEYILGKKSVPSSPYLQTKTKYALA